MGERKNKRKKGVPRREGQGHGPKKGGLWAWGSGQRDVQHAPKAVNEPPHQRRLEGSRG